MAMITFEDLPSTNTPINAANLNNNFSETEPVNSYNTSTSKSYSCNYINEMDKYSTTETKTNKIWIDGKPIYRKVLEYNNVTSVLQINMSSYNIDYMVYCTFIEEVDDGVNNNYGNWYNIWNGATQKARIFWRRNTQYLIFDASDTVKKLYLIIEYTKTTD